MDSKEVSDENGWRSVICEVGNLLAEAALSGEKNGCLWGTLPLWQIEMQSDPAFLQGSD